MLAGEAVGNLARSFQRSLAVDWIGLYRAGLSFEEAIERGRADLVPEAVQWAARQGGSVTRGELVNRHPDMPPLPDDNYGKGRDQDLEFQCNYVRASFERYWMAGEPVPPYFVERIAVLLRRVGDRERELKVLRAWYRHVGDRPRGEPARKSDRAAAEDGEVAAGRGGAALPLALGYDGFRLLQAGPGFRVISEDLQCDGQAHDQISRDLQKLVVVRAFVEEVDEFVALGFRSVRRHLADVQRLQSPPAIDGLGFAPGQSSTAPACSSLRHRDASASDPR